MQYILSLAVSLIPLLSITFVTLLILYKLYVRIRSNFKVTVNCWFCNQNTKVPYLEANCFTCPQCEQYNGFTRDGDYNREIYQQLDCSNLSSTQKDEHHHDLSDFSDQFPANGFCQVCNEGQRLKVEKLAQFEPKNESKFDAELKAYKLKLEEQYRLCTTCDRHLKRVLREKKKMVLGSKFLDFIIKGAETFKQPHFARLKNAQKSKLKRKISTCLAILALVNALCVLRSLPDLKKDTVTSILGEKIGHYAFLMISHVLALVKVFASYSAAMGNHHTLQKIGLFFKTIVMMILYSMGMKLPQVTALNMSSLLVLISPFLMLCLAFIHNLVDTFKLSRFTFMLTLWSVCAGGLLDYEEVIPARDVILVGPDLICVAFFVIEWRTLLYFQLTASVLTVWLSFSSKSNTNASEIDDTTSSFHKIYSEDGLSDDDTRETISLISQKLNSSGNSVISGSSCRSFMSQPHLNLSSLARTPITSSVLSLNGIQRSPIGRSIDQSVAMNRNYAASMCSFPSNQSMFASNLELNYKRPQSAFGANASFSSPFVMNATIAPIHNKQRDDSLQDLNRSSLHYKNAPLASPFSVSSSAVYQRSNLLTPSRFSTNSLVTNNPSASWLSGGYFNNTRVDPIQQPLADKRNFFLEHRNGMNSIQENISRASSHSSGFESQSSATLRENSICPDQEQYPQMTNSHSDCHNGFYPIDNNAVFQRTSNLNTTFQPPMASPAGSLCGFSSQINVNPTLQPLSVNCSQDYWKPIKANPTANGMNNAFNLRKINEELPPIQRGALLKKWKEGQTLS